MTTSTYWQFSFTIFSLLYSFLTDYQKRAKNAVRTAILAMQNQAGTMQLQMKVAVTEHVIQVLREERRTQYSKGDQ